MKLEEISQKEILRYLGYGNTAPDERVTTLMKECIQEILQQCSMRHIYRKFCCSHHQNHIAIGTMHIESKNLAKNLADCEEAILFAATLGPQADMLLKRYNRLDMSKAVVMQAAAAAIIEEYCDQCQEEIRKLAAKEQKFLRPRFSPGYGDFALTHQKDFIALLDCPKKIGLTVTESLLLAPSKSVTAVIGLSQKDKHCHTKGCETCEKINCAFRREAV